MTKTIETAEPTIIYKTDAQLMFEIHGILFASSKKSRKWNCEWICNDNSGNPVNEKKDGFKSQEEMLKYCVEYSKARSSVDI